MGRRCPRPPRLTGDADPPRRYVIKINGLAVGEVRTDEDGDGKLELRSDYRDGDDDDEDRMPDWFPTLLPGDEVKVGGYDGTFSRHD